MDISQAIESYIRRQPRPAAGKYGIIEDYGGHGIGTEMHMDPHLLNYVARKRGKGTEAGPGLLPGDRADGLPRHAPHRVLEDDWTVITTDGTWSSHWEHSIALTEEGPLVLTAPDGGRAKLARWGHGVDPLADADRSAWPAGRAGGWRRTSAWTGAFRHSPVRSTSAADS